MLIEFNKLPRELKLNMSSGDEVYDDDKADKEEELGEEGELEEEELDDDDNSDKGEE